MRTLTKTGIRVLTKRYISVLKKCAILNAMVLMFGVNPSFAVDVTDWNGFKNAVNNTNVSEINVNNNITYDGATDNISRTLSIIGNATDRYLNGDDVHRGFYVYSNGNLSLTNITMKNFTRGAGSVIYNNSATVDTLTGKFISNIVSECGGVIYNSSGTVNNINAVFSENAAITDGGAIYNYANILGPSIIDNIKGTFESNTAGGNGGAIANYTDGETAQINIINATFNNNEAYDKGGAIYNDAEATISIEQSVFTSNTAEHGGAIYNEGTISNIVGDFTLNTATKNGGAINNNGATAKITNITGDFKNNSANSAGGAIYNLSSGEISNIAGDFENNSATGNGGAICNFNGSAKIGNIAGDFKGNHTDNNGGAIYNSGIIENIIGDFENNSATNWGGAILSSKTINKVTGNFTKNYAKNGGAVYNARDTINFVAENGKNITFSGNYVTDESGKGGAIFNGSLGTGGTVGLYADEGHSITFTGDKTGLPNTAKNVDSIHNLNILNINGDGTDTYTGTVNLYNVTDAGAFSGTTNIYGGTVNVKDTLTQMTLNLNAGTLNLGRNANVGNFYINEGAKLSLSIPNGTFGNYKNEINTLTTGFYSGVLSDLTVDYDATAAEGSNMDKIIINGAGSGSVAPNSSIKLTSVNVIKDGDTMNNGIFLTGTPAGTLDNLDDVTETITSTTTSGGYKYTFTPSSKGVVTVTRTAAPTTLAQVIQDATAGDTYSITTNPYTTNEDLGSLAGIGRNFTIFGNGNAIDGTNPASGKFNGITVGNSSGQEFTLENATMQNFTTAITNKTGATTNINGVTFTNNTTDIANDGTLNLSGANTIDTLTGTGLTEIKSSTTTINNSITQNNINVKNATLALSENTVATTATKPLVSSVFTLDNSTLNLQNDSTGTVYLGGMRIVGTNNLMLDADLAEGTMDQLSVSSIGGLGTLNISDIHLMSDATQDNISLKLFTDDTTTDVYNKVSGNLNGLKYSPTYIYDAKYSTADGKITFTRTEQANPYLYAPSSVAQTTASITGQIAGLAMDKLDVAVTDSEKGLAAGDMPKANNAWVKVMGFDDDVDFKHFNTIDSKAYTLAAGFNTDKVKFDHFDAAFGVYGGYIGGRQKYTDNKIEQNGGYVGLSSELTKGNAFLLSTIDTGFINNENENMYGTDKFDTRWFGIGLKGGYNYALTDSWTLQPNLYAGYTLVNTEDYTSKSGVRINNDNLNFFEIDPGFKLTKQIDNGWLGYIQGKYAIVMDNGGETTANEYILPNISAKNYFEYGFGMNKSLTDAWSLNGEINRRDGGRTGWNGAIEFKYNF